MKRVALLAAAMGIAFLAVAPSRPGRAGVIRIYVDQAAGGANNGTSWTDAYVDLQSALAAASNPAEIWVAAGTYIPGTSRTDSFVLKSGVPLYGGFFGGETSVTQRNPTANPTTLSGAIGTAAITDNSYHVVDASTVGASAALDGFVVSGGFANGGGSFDDGGGMTMSSGSPVIRNVVFRGNYAQRGGGAFVDSGSPLFDSVTFEGNGAYDGGGLHTVSGAPEVRNSRFLSNDSNRGGGFYSSSSNNPLISSTLFRGNTADTYGGAIHNPAGVLRVEASGFFGNVAQ